LSAEGIIVAWGEDRKGRVIADPFQKGKNYPALKIQNGTTTRHGKKRREKKN